MAATETLDTVIATAKAVKNMVIEECAEVADEFRRPGLRAPSDLSPEENAIWNNCAARIAVSIRALKKS